MKETILGWERVLAWTGLMHYHGIFFMAKAWY